MPDNDLSQPDDGVKQLIAWGETQPLIRAIILTSTRAVPGALVSSFEGPGRRLSAPLPQPAYQ